MEWHAPSLANAPSNVSATCWASMRRTRYCWATFCIHQSSFSMCLTCWRWWLKVHRLWCLTSALTFCNPYKSYWLEWWWVVHVIIIAVQIYLLFPPPPPPTPPDGICKTFGLWAFILWILNYRWYVYLSTTWRGWFCKHVRGTLLLEGLFYMSCIEAIHHLGGTRRRQELHLCWQQLKVSCHGNRNVLFHRQDFGTVALLVCAEYKGRVDTLDSWWQKLIV